MRQRNKPPINQHSENPTPKDSWWATEMIPEPEDKPHLTEGGAGQAAASERQKKKKKKNTTQLPGKIMTELLLKYQHQDWCNTRT
jgi:hypothetical protein